MRLLSFLVTSVILLAAESRDDFPDFDTPLCTDGDRFYVFECSSMYLQCLDKVMFVQFCPDGFYFDLRLARCERRPSVGSCNEKHQTTVHIPKKAITINCIGRLNTHYPLDKTTCKEVFYECVNGISIIKKCPYNQVYNPILKRCDNSGNCNKFSAVKEHAAAAHISPTYDADNYVVTVKEFENGHKGIDCTVLGDLYFINDNQCSPYFWQCSNGKLFRKSCPKGLFYILSRNLCDYPQAVKGCPEYDGTMTAYESADEPPQSTTYAPSISTTFEALLDQAPYVPAAAPSVPVYHLLKTTESVPVPTTPAPAKPSYVPQQNPTSAPVYSPPSAYQPDVHGDCSIKEDGFYEIKPCHTEFLTCGGGVGRIIACASELVFDSRISACDFLEVCQRPRKQEDIPVLYNHGGANDEKPVEIKINFNCSGKADGYYFKEACTKEFFRCLGGRALSVVCPADLVYNKATSTCDYADSCEKNYMEPSQIYKQNEQPSTNVGYENTVSHTTQTPKADTQTARYAEPPTPIYSWAGNTKEPATVEYETTTSAEDSTEDSVTFPISLDDFSCVNMIDGNHASGLCKNIFFTCSHNQLTATKCPESLVYNPYIGQCDYHTNVRDCAGFQPVETATSYSAHSTTKRHSSVVTTGYATQGYFPSTTEASRPYQFATQPPKYIAFCERLADGHYGQKCENHFIKCNNFETFKISCPDGLYYSLLNDKCDYKENVEGCPEYKRTPHTTPKTTHLTSSTTYTRTEYPSIDYTTTTPGQVDTTPLADSFSCNGRPDGIYALPYCSKDYVQCIHGRSLIASCVSGLFYSEKNGLCDYKKNVDICQIRLGSDIIDDNACVGRADGYFSAGCSSHYFSCADERIQKLTCPSTLKYSEKKGACAFPVDVKECSIATEGERSLPPIPSDFCIIRPNGLHAFKLCSPHYVVCDNGRAIAGTCAAPLIFNVRNQLCDYKINNNECGSDYVKSTTDSTVSYNVTKASEQPYSTTTSEPYQPQKTETGEQIYKAPPSVDTKPNKKPATTRIVTVYNGPTDALYDTAAIPPSAPYDEIQSTTTAQPYAEATSTAAQSVTYTTKTPYAAPYTTN